MRTRWNVTQISSVLIPGSQSRFLEKDLKDSIKESSLNYSFSWRDDYLFFEYGSSIMDSYHQILLPMIDPDLFLGYSRKTDNNTNTPALFGYLNRRIQNPYSWRDIMRVSAHKAFLG